MHALMVFLGKMLYSHIGSPQPGEMPGTSDLSYVDAGTKPPMDWLHIQRGVAILSVTSHYRNQISVFCHHNCIE